MSEFKELFEKTDWGWRMRGYDNATSPVTLWQCAGTPPRFQVNVHRWADSTHVVWGQAETAAVALARKVG